MAEHTIAIQNYQFNPPTGDPVVIGVGDSVKWLNRDGTRHNAMREEAPTFATRLLGKDDTSDPIVFGEATAADGIEYQCGPHPFMKGRIIVALRGTHAAAYTLQEAQKAEAMHEDRGAKK